MKKNKNKNKTKEIAVNKSSGAEKVENIVEEKRIREDGETFLGAEELNGAIPFGVYGATVGGLGASTVGDAAGNPIGNPLLASAVLNGAGELDEKRPKSEREIIEEKAREERKAADKRVENARRKAEREKKSSRRGSKGSKSSKGAKGSNGGRNGNNGNGGWIAAVSILGATTLALGAVVTVGAIERRDTMRGIGCGHQANAYELIALVEYADADLDRARVSNSPAQQSRILTDLLVQTRLAENVLEKLPVDSRANGNLTAFFNRTSFLCERLLSKLRRGQVLDERDMEALERAYETNAKAREILDGTLGKYESENWLEFSREKKNEAKDGISSLLKELEDVTLDENNVDRNALPDVRAWATPKDADKEKISSSKAEELCRAYFSEYKIRSIEFQGETVSRAMEAYNFSMKDENGVELFAQLSGSNGDLISFDYYERCEEHNLDLDNAKSVAEKFLERIGYDELTAVKANETGTTASLTFVYESDGVTYYPDAIEVKVCEQKGIVVGFNAAPYLRNHRERTLETPKVTMAQARENLSEKLELEGSRVALIRVGRGERLAYEFVCTYDGGKYFVYVDAETGEELSILNAGKTR